MIENIYIIDMKSGVSLFSLDLIQVENPKPIDPQIFSGFLKVLNDLSQETRNEDINEVILQSSRFIYEKTNVSGRELMLVSIDNKKKWKQRIKKVLNKILDEFKNDYSKEIQEFRGNVGIFGPFEQKVKDIITLEFGPMKEKMALIHKMHPFEDFISQYQKRNTLHHLELRNLKIKC